jgi:hypothetical protein
MKVGDVFEEVGRALQPIHEGAPGAGDREKTRRSRSREVNGRAVVRDGN